MYTIAVCDDDRDIVAALEIYLTAEGYQVEKAYNGREVLTLLAHKDIHLLLLDVMMPQMDGLTTLSRLRETSNVPVILLTAKSEDTDKVLFIINLLAGCMAVHIAWGLRQLEKGAEKLAEGDYSHPIPLKRLHSGIRRSAEKLNALQDGAKKAVAQQLKSERMKTELITNVSHDIKTPLTSIVNYVDLLQKEDIPNERVQEYLAVLDRQSKRLKKLTEDLVELSKASSGALTVNRQSVDVNVLISQVEGEYRERLENAGLTLVVLPGGEAANVMADPVLLSRVADNLMTNVCKYAMPGTRVYVSVVSGGGKVTISVKNVSREELNITAEELQERFVRGDHSRTTEGSGLGLSITRSLVELQGGRFAVTIDGDLFRADVTFPAE